MNWNLCEIDYLNTYFYCLFCSLAKVNNMNIYCVDDSHLHISKMTEVIKAVCSLKDISDYQLIECSDATQLIEKAKYYPPFLITMDINMPSMDGLSALVRMRKMYPNCIIVMVSSESKDVVKRLCTVDTKKHFDADDAKKQEMLDKVIARVKSGVKEPGKINSVLEACASLGMDPIVVAKNNGADAFISKPFDIAEASKKISSILKV